MAKKTLKEKKILFKPLGFTLIESLVALSVIVIGLVVVLQIFPTGLSVEKSNQLETQAVLAAQEKVESLTALSFSELLVGQTTENPLPSPLEKFSRTTKISFVDQNIQETGTATSLKKIEVIVAWKSPLKIGEKEIKITTLFADK